MTERDDRHTALEFLVLSLLAIFFIWIFVKIIFL
jgi:hypothetical protein